MTVIDWLLDSDPAIRWQVLRDLVHAPTDVVAAERARIATQGWGARLLDLEGEDGQWDGGALFPGPIDQFQGPGQFGEGQPWSATAYSLMLLRDFGIAPGMTECAGQSHWSKRTAVGSTQASRSLRARSSRASTAWCLCTVRTSIRTSMLWRRD